ncbi:MAG: YARHG domain-containing protein [Lachnospiraceae bacterium]|nr:YARHG domain-containing protein [Lachnospiraceae bacterium]
MKEKAGKAKKGNYRSVAGIFAAVLMCIFFQKSVPVRAAGVSGYIFPESAERYMSVEELNGLPLQLINYGKNEIYARHGRRFRSQELQAYFDGQSWYSGSISPDEFDENSLNEYERINAHMINDFEHQYNAEGYKLDQDGYSYEAVYAYLTQAEENTSGGENDGFEEDGSVDFEAADGASNTEDTVLEDGTVQHKSLYGTVTFKLEYQDGGQSLYGVIRAEDISGAVLWEQSTDSYMCAGYAQVTDLGIHGNRYYYEEGGTIVAIRIADGAILWKSVQALGAPRCCFGEGDMIYLCGYYGPDFVALDRTGEALQYINSLDADFAYTTAIWYEAGTVYVTKDGSASGQSAKTFSVDVSWMEPEQTEENGKETEIKGENSDTEKSGTEDGRTANQENEEEMLTEDSVKTEGQQEETVTYDDWIRLNMVPTLGVCGNGTFANIVSNNDYGNWFEQTGIVSRYEEDLDGDGATEAIVVYLKKDEENSCVNLHVAILKKQGEGIKITQDMDCMKIWGMAEDTQFFTFEQTGRKHFVLQSFCQFNGISERLTIFHVTEAGKIEADCIISDPGYTSGLALQKIEGEWNGDRMYSENDYENTKDVYSYDGTDELMNCAENSAYGEAFNGQIQPYSLEAAVSETAFHASMWRVKEDDLTELCRVYSASESMGTTTDGILVYKYTYDIYDNTGVKDCF